MGAPNPEMTAADVPSAESLLGALKTIDGSEKLKHASVLEYWLSIRGDREFPPLHDLDPLEISDAGPNSLLLELIGGGEDAEIRHLGAGLKNHVEGDRIATAPRPSILASIAKKLSIVAISRNFLAFEDEFTIGPDTTRCWVTLYPLSAAGAWVDYVYALVSFDTKPAEEATERLDASSDPDADLQHAEPPIPEIPPNFCRSKKMSLLQSRLNRRRSKSNPSRRSIKRRPALKQLPGPAKSVRALPSFSRALPAWADSMRRMPPKPK